MSTYQSVTGTGKKAVDQLNYISGFFKLHSKEYNNLQSMIKYLEDLLVRDAGGEF